MKTKKIIFYTLIFAVVLISGCAPKVKPTDICKYDIPISKIYFGEEFDFIDFFDLAIEIAKDNHFQPPMEYDKNEGLLVFGNEEVDTMPGLKMVVYMWLGNSPSGTIDNVCINSQILEVKGSSLTEGTSKEAILTFKEALERKYSEKLENIKRLRKKYQTN